MARFYFVYTNKRDSRGRKLNGRYLGIPGWSDGLNGPHTKNRARQIKGKLGGRIVPIDLDDADELLEKALAQARGTTAPDVMKGPEEEDPENDPEEDPGEDPQEEDSQDKDPEEDPQDEE